ncbi:hypothetical protein BDZ89DRAFT_1049154 [Hymenopellis radicata]|nr:hypothetical protein BDZ89DRAFT_1049154 [Hymenopellis radicata]
MPSIGLDSSALMTLAMDAPRDRRAFNRFSAVLTRMSGTEIPSTPLEPTDDPDDSLNAAVSIFRALNMSILFGFLRKAGSPAAGSLYSEEASTLVIKIMPYLTNWISYFLIHIILPGRESEFCHDFAQLSATLLAGFADERHPAVYREIQSLPAPKELQSEGNHLFLACVLPKLLFCDASSSPSSREEVVVQCFIALGDLLSVNKKPFTLSPQAQEVYNALRKEPETLADLFQSCVITLIGRLRASNLHVSRDDFQHVVTILATTYRGFLEFLLVRRVADRLVRNEHVRWTCELLCEITESRRLRQFVNSPELNNLPEYDKLRKLIPRRELLIISNGCVLMAYQHLDRLILIFGHLAQQVYKGKAVLSILRMQHLMSQAHPVLILTDEQARVESLKATAVLKYAIRTDRHTNRILTPELLASSSWNIYQKQLKDMTVLYELYKQHPMPICDGPECPNLRSTEPHPLHICSGCNLYYYCSEGCQKRAWEASHREVCGSHQELQAISSRDAHFFDYITREVMRAHVNSDRSLVRHIDFRQCPPLVELRSLSSYNTEEYRSEYKSIKEGLGVPMVSIMPMGARSIKWSQRHGTFDASYRGGIQYNPLTSDD